MKKTSIFMAGAAVLTLLVLLFCGWRMTRSFQAADMARADRDAEFERLRRIFNTEPFPSTENAKVVREDTEALAAMRRELVSAMNAGNIPLQDLSPSLFIQALQQSLRNRLYAQAPVVEGARIVTDNFGFGFDRYRGEGAPMPNVADVPRLAQQLKITERLVEAIYAAQVNTLSGFRRTEFDNPTATGAATDDGVSRRRDRRDRATAATTRSSAKVVETDLYTAQHFTLELTGRQTAIMDLLNRFAAMDLFVVVTEIELRKSAEDVRVPPRPEGAIETTPGGGGASDGEADLAVVSTLPPSQRLMSGPDVDPPLNVRIELDVYNIKGA